MQVFIERLANLYQAMGRYVLAFALVLCAFHSGEFL